MKLTAPAFEKLIILDIPSSFLVGKEVSVLRVSGDECGQTLFFVEVIESGTED